VAAPLAPPRDFAIPEPGSTTARDVLSRALSRLLSELPGAARDAGLARVIRVALGSHAGAVASIARRPHVATLVRCLRAGADEALAIELTTLLYLELALAGALAAPVTLPRFPRRIVSLTARAAVTVPDDAERLTVTPDELVLHRRGSDVHLRLESLSEVAEAPYHAITPTIELALADNNPLALHEAHPDKSGNAVDLGGRPVSEWTRSLASALEVIGEQLPELRAEIDLYVQQIVPVGWDAERHLSASYQEAIGTVYLSLHPSPMTLAEALVHEASHNKLNALFELDDVLENADAPLYGSPIRPDPRPLRGILLAVHAFLPVARLYERMLGTNHPLAGSAAFAERFARIREINHEGAGVLLAHARPTDVGRGLLDEIQRWGAHYT